MSLTQPDYIEVLSTLKEKIKLCRAKAIYTVNAQLLQLYWEIGYLINEQETAKGWGAKVVVQLSKDLSLEFPDMKGFSERNLRYMRDFAIAYPMFGGSSEAILQQGVARIEPEQYADFQDINILQQAIAKLPWGQHVVILTKLKGIEERGGMF